MIHTRLLLRAVLVGTVLQLVLALCAHLFPWVAGHVLLFGWMMCSATAGYVYGLTFGRGYVVGAFGGAISGGLCAVPGVAIPVLAGDSPASMMAVATGICILTGGVGGAFGHMGAMFRKLGF